MRDELISTSVVLRPSSCVLLPAMSNNFSFARRTEWNLTVNKLMTVLADLQQRDIAVLDLTESNPTQCGFNYLDDRIVAPLSKAENLVYAPQPAGLPAARGAVREYYRQKNVEIEPGRIFLSSSTSEAYSYLFRLLLNPGEKVLVPIPSYPLFQYLVELNDAVLGQYPLFWEDGVWRLDATTLAESVTPDTRAIILVNPNNPTGSFLKESELLAVNQLAQKHQLALICDEVFLDFDWPGRTEPITLAANEEVLTFVLGGISKTLGLPQMKLAWIAINGPPAHVSAAAERLEIIADTYLSVNTPSQNSLGEWMGLRKDIHKEIGRRLSANWGWLEDRLRKVAALKLLAAEGGWYAILKFPDSRTEEEWVMELLERDRVFVHPGFFFDFYEEPFIIVSLLTPEAVFMEGIERILARLQRP